MGATAVARAPFEFLDHIQSPWLGGHSCAPVRAIEAEQSTIRLAWVGWGTTSPRSKCATASEECWPISRIYAAPHCDQSCYRECHDTAATKIARCVVDTSLCATLILVPCMKAQACRSKVTSCASPTVSLTGRSNLHSALTPRNLQCQAFAPSLH
jgi:hypothetical protein